MTRRLIHLALLAAILVGGYRAWRSGRERARLEAEYARLAAKVGDLPVGDPTRYHFRALQTGDPMHFAWRAYLPANARTVVRRGGSGEGSSLSSVARDEIARVRFRETEPGLLEVYTRFSGGSSRSTLSRPGLAALLRDRWADLKVEQLGSDDLAVVPAGRPATLLRLTLPDDLVEAARGEMPGPDGAALPVLFELELNPASPSP